MATNAPQQTSATNGPAEKSPAESIDQVRDLLFGGQMRMFDARIQSLDERLLHEAAALRSDFDRRVAELDAASKAEFARHTEQLNAERTKRVEDLRALSAEFAATSARIASELDRITKDLKAEKLDSSALAEGLTELATRLTSSRPSAG